MRKEKRWNNVLQRCRVCLPVIGLVSVATFLLLHPIYRHWTSLPASASVKSIPEFSLASVTAGERGLSDKDLAGITSIVNVWASWCSECRIEHPVFMDLARRNLVNVYGLNFRDAPEQARAWLQKNGNPYTRIGADQDGRVASEWGIYGVPETLLIDGNGRVLHRHSGALTAGKLDEHFLPLIQKASAR